RVDHRLVHDEEPKMYQSVKESLAGRIRRRNAWGNEVTKKHPTIVNFIGVDPNFLTPEENVEELELRVKEGAKGVALHTTRNLHRPEDRRLYPMYERAQEMGIPFLAHTGNEGYRPAYMGLNSRPSDFKYVFQDFPRLRFILCHMGAGYFEEAIELAHKNPNVYFDTAGQVSGGSPPQFSDEELVRLIRRFGSEKLMFGSDWSLSSMLESAKRLISLPLTNREKELIFYRNAHDFLAS
ncbi:MAG: amidohydrolase family protein, partial [Chloroflexota bacterium]